MTVFRHKKTGGLYDLLSYAKMQSAAWHTGANLFDLVDQEQVVVYRSQQDGSTWVRPRAEFEDGRFEQVST